MSAAEVERGDARRIADQIGQYIAAARGNRDHVAVALERQRLEVDVRVFPDLGVDETVEQSFEEAFEDPFATESAVPAHRLLQSDTAFHLRMAQPDHSGMTPIHPQ